MKPASESLPSDLAAAHAMILAERNARIVAEAEAASAQADLSSSEALIAHLKLEIEKLRRTLYGPRAERTARLIDQLELQLEELEASATEDDLAAEQSAGKTQTVRSFQRKRPVRKPFPDDIQRERVVIEAPVSCPCCGGSRLSKLGEDVTETLEVIPRQWKVIETVREKFTCRDCEAITQPPAPFHATPRGFIGPKLLATILFDKFAQHMPLNRQSQRFKCEGIDLGVSTLADQVGAGVFAALPLYRLIEAHVLAAERLHGDDTTVPILAKGKTIVAHRQHLHAPLVLGDRDHRWLVQHDATALDVYQRIRRAQVDGHIGRQHAQKSAQHYPASRFSKRRTAVWHLPWLRRKPLAEETKAGASRPAGGPGLKRPASRA